MAFLVKGVKFACEPCIRGHRSSKCQHVDRNLVEVRKPGRPLSSCPHAAGQRCNCNRGVRVAVPKSSSCACGSNPSVSISHGELTPPSSRSSQHDMTNGQIKGDQLTANSVISVDTSSATIHPVAASFDVSSAPNPRIQSQYEGAIKQSPLHTESMQTEATPDINRKSSSGLADLRSNSQEQVGNGLVHGNSNSNVNTTYEQIATIDSTNQKTNGIELQSEPSKMSAPPRRSCCQPPLEIPEPAQEVKTENPQNSQEQYYPTIGSGSQLPPANNPVSYIPLSNGPTISHLASTVYKFPAPLSTWEHPLTPEGLARIQRAGITSPESLDNSSISSSSWNPISRAESLQLLPDSYSNPLLSPQEGSTADAVGLPPNTSHWPPANTLHVCQCGADCSCPMCPAHPYNKASAEALQSMAQAMNFGEPASPTINFNGQFSDQGGMLGMSLQDPVNLNPFVGSSIVDEPLMSQLTNPIDGNVPFTSQEGPVFTTAEYYHLYYPSTWIENNSDPSPH